MNFSDWKALETPQRRSVLYLAALVIVVYAAAIAFSVTTILGYRAGDDRNHQARMSPTQVEPGRTPPDPFPPGGNYVTVKVGTYVDAITNVSIRDSSWESEFYVWFNWSGPKDLDPGGKLMLVEGTIKEKQRIDEYHGQDGVNYQKYRIVAKFNKIFNTALVPVERPMLNIYIEDGARDGTALRYTADSTSNISSRARSAGYDVTRVAYVVKPHTYRTSYGDPRKPASQRATFSQYVVGISLKKAGIGVYLKVFLCLYAALALALASFFIKPTDTSPRFSLPTASYFGVVANSYIVNAVLPPSNTFGMIDFVICFALGTIFLTVALSLLSNWLYDRKGEKAFALAVDRIMFFTIAICSVAGNILIPLSSFW